MRLLEEYVCPLCRQSEVAYYCESCSAMFCSSCAKKKGVEYCICETCGAIFYLDGKSDPPAVCGSCKSDFFRKGIRKMIVCPRCLSANVIDLVTKKEGQTARLSSIVHRLLSVVPLMLGAINSVSKLKTRLLSIRRSGLLHNPSLEEEILGLYEGISAVKIKAITKAEAITGGLVSKIASLIREWSPSKIREVEVYFEQLEGALKEYLYLVESECKRIEEKIKEVAAALDALDFHRRFFDEFRWILDLEDHEKPVGALPNVKYTGSTYLTSNKGTGIIFLTTERIIFLKREGLVRRSFKKQFSLSLNDVELNVRKGIVGRSFTLKTSKGLISFTAPSQILDEVKAYYMLAKKFNEYSLTNNSLTAKLEGTSVGLNDFRKTIASLVSNALKAEERRTPAPPRPPPPARRLHPPRRLTRPEKNMALLADLEKKRFTLEQRLKKLEELRANGEISMQDYVKLWGKIQGDLKDLDEEIRRIRAT